jgi:hypothetical protein
MATDIGVANGTEPLWNGATVTPTPPSTSYYCPQIWRANFQVYSPNWMTDVRFAVLTPVTLQRIRGYTAYNVPMGEYGLNPMEQFSSYSPDDTFRGMGGELWGVCEVYNARTWAGRLVQHGFVRWYHWENGQFWRQGYGGPGGGGERGWGWYDSNSGQYYGAGGIEFRAAVDAFLEHGTCTAGWEIWVDGVQRCDADGNGVG